MTGNVISHYEILEHLGEGGMGVIYKARDTRLDRLVALKFLPRHLSWQDDANNRFIIEAQAASSLNHPNVCTIHEIGQAEDGRRFIAMAYYEGETLEERLEKGRVDRGEAFRIARHIAEGLAAAHEKEIVHRDIKPGNVMITDRGRAVILDFGIAKLVNRSGITKTGLTVGTAAYMSPEQSLGGETTPKTDVWSLGVVLYELLLGELPFAADYEQAVIYNILNSEPKGLARLRALHGDPVADLVEACLSKSPDDRPDSSTVTEILAGFGDSANTIRRRGAKLPRRLLSRRTLAWAGLLLVTLVCLWLASNSLIESVLRAPKGPVAVFAEGVPTDSVLGAATTGFVEALTHEAVRLSQERILPRFVVPAGDLLRFGIHDGAAADSMLGVGDVVTVRVEHVSSGLYRMGMFLREATSGAVTDSVVGAYTNLRRAHDRALEVLGRFLGANSAVSTSIPPDIGTGLFEEYLTVLGLTQLGDAVALEAAIALRDSVVASGIQFPQVHGALAEAYWVRFGQTRDTTLIYDLMRAAEVDGALDSPRFSTVLGQAYLTIDRPAAAEKTFWNSLERDSTYVPALVQLTRFLNKRGRYREADSLHARIVAIQPDYWLGHMRYGQFLYTQARYADAAIQFEMVVDQAPGLSMGYAGLGAARWALDDLEAAKAALLRSPVRDFNILSNLGTLSFYLDNYRDAVRYYEEALAINPDDQNVLANLASVYYWLPNEEQNFKTSVKEALRRAKPLLDEHPDDLSLKAQVANYYAMLGDTTDALVHLKPFLKEPWDQVDGRTAFSVAAAWEEIGERERALVWIRAALEKKYARNAIDRYPGIESLRADPRYKAMVDSMSPGV
jgi:serine/threonine-protein kinase